MGVIAASRKGDAAYGVALIDDARLAVIANTLREDGCQLRLFIGLGHPVAIQPPGDNIIQWLQGTAEHVSGDWCSRDNA